MNSTGGGGGGGGVVGVVSQADFQEGGLSVTFGEFEGGG